MVKSSPQSKKDC
jgi:hypothetical protein